jgi:(S)-3,5-dihydroxyphenylglycine transaminase
MSVISEAMNLLNEVAGRYPGAISLAAGRPADQFVRFESVDTYLEVFEAWWRDQPPPRADARTLIAQYSDTNGIIRELIARYLLIDEGLNVDARSCMLTNGAQEAIAITLLSLCDEDRFVAAQDPTYVGLTGAASVLGIPFRPIPPDVHILKALDKLATGAPRLGVFYCVPDFCNPGAEVMDVATRRSLAELAARKDFYVIEDAAYRKYRYDGDDMPTIKSFDQNGRVIYIESFAKTVIPAMRLAVMVADEEDGAGKRLAERLASIKSYVSVATSPITQAMLGGILLSTGFTLRDWTVPRREACRRNRDALLLSLATHFGNVPGVSWGRPDGGFFLTMRLPFRFGAEEMVQCADEAGVIVVPVSIFSSGSHFDWHIRIAFSNATPEQLEQGVIRLAAYVARRLESEPEHQHRTASAHLAD